MPNLNGTEPSGKGAMSGGKRGRCRNLKSQNIQKEKQSKEAYSLILCWMVALLGPVVK